MVEKLFKLIIKNRKAVAFLLLQPPYINCVLDNLIQNKHRAYYLSYGKPYLNQLAN